ncbi:hypothetical protein BJK34_19505 [Escherichia coli]|nr:hypothetical protein NRG857_20660 [Escherichia coli O83:H1 str. NRG 857C]ALD27243.1 hypothetical protein AN206_23640 [Escherichia coli]EFM51864.1 hypothetical protein ECNC101_04063 [Escherichia coli NC101]EIL81483.1 hypothetical protein ECHM605_03795 [Escherichia coli HM605]ESE12525.1 hypothetical protein HMPREF1617_03759 [Escherichia coli 908675]KIE81297.1 hypothetical protein SC80_14470 [Escherichia coli RS218]KKJ21404.1 hypothetical protein T638_05240 [Escherichia coli MRSN 10204]KZF31
MAGVREDDCEQAHGFIPLPGGARRADEKIWVDYSAFQVIYSHKLRSIDVPLRI